jgi:COP9 signalosome complex subunit 12
MTYHRRILTYLLPLRLLQGHLPSEDLLQRFPILAQIFYPFISAIRKGDITAFDEAMDKWETQLIDLNLWLTLEKAREICLRGLFRKVSVSSVYYRLFYYAEVDFRWIASEKSSRVPIGMFHAAMKMSGQDIPQEETECLLANAIYKGFIRGYISHEKQTVVLANTNAFPKLTDRPSPFGMLS